MGDPKLLRGLARQDRREAAAVNRVSFRKVGELIGKCGRSLRRRRLGPGEPARLVERARRVLEQDATPLVTEVLSRTGGNSAALRAMALFAGKRTLVEGSSETCFELATTVIQADRRHLVARFRSGRISIFEHAYERYRQRDGGPGLQAFARDVLEAISWTAPLLWVEEGEDVLPVFIPCGEGALVGYRRRVEAPPRGFEMRFGRHAPIIGHPDDAFIREDGDQTVFDLRTFIDGGALREPQQRLLARMAAVGQGREAALAFAAKAVLVGAFNDESSDTDAAMTIAGQASDELARIYDDPAVQTLWEAARRADPYNVILPAPAEAAE